MLSQKLNRTYINTCRTYMLNIALVFKCLLNVYLTPYLHTALRNKTTNTEKYVVHNETVHFLTKQTNTAHHG